jgi:hypothetical protein
VDASVKLSIGFHASFFLGWFQDSQAFVTPAVRVAHVCIRIVPGTLPNNHCDLLELECAQTGLPSLGIAWHVVGIGLAGMAVHIRRSSDRDVYTRLCLY